MKKLTVLLLIMASLNAFPQNNKWFVSLSANPTIGGPSGSIKKEIIRQGFDQTSSSTIIVFQFDEDHPVVTKGPALILRAGKKIDEKKSIYFITGLAYNSTVEGYKITGAYTDWWLFAGTNGLTVKVNTKVYQLGAGYMYSGRDRVKFGFGPAIYLVNYRISQNERLEKHTALTAGATATCRLPLGRERKLIGVDLVAELNLAPPVKMKADEYKAGDFKPGRVNMIGGNLGFALTIRR